MKNVKIILISVALTATVFANSRIDALGGDAGFWAGDRANIGSFPATINDHGFVELDNVGADGNVDATILWGDATKWGFGFDGDDDNTWFNIMWGNGDMGLNVRYVNNDDGDSNTGNDPSGFNVAYGQNFDWGELGVGFNSGVGEDGAWNNDASSYWVNWRGALGAWVFDTAKAGLAMTDDGGDNTTTSLSFDMFTHLDAGGADVMFGLGTDYVSTDMGGTSTSSMTLPSASIAVEAALTDWATVRAFSNHTYYFSCDGAAECNDGGSGSGASTWGFGLGFDWGQLALDMSVGTALFTDPVSTITGYDGAGDLSDGEVTLSYTF